VVTFIFGPLLFKNYSKLKNKKQQNTDVEITPMDIRGGHSAIKQCVKYNGSQNN